MCYATGHREVVFVMLYKQWTETRTKHPYLSHVFNILLLLMSTVFLVTIISDHQSANFEKALIQRKIRTSLIDVDCSCQSLFTIGACNFDTMQSKLPNSKSWRRLIRQLKAARSGKPFSITHALHELSRYLPSLLTSKPKFNISKENIKRNTLMYEFSNDNSTQFNSKNLTKIKGTFKDLSDNIVKQRPLFMDCDVHTYSEEDISICLQRREKLTGNIFKIAFVGDSQVRNLMEEMIMHLRERLNLTVGDESGLNLNTGFLDNKVKYDLPVQGNGVELRLYWSSFLGMAKNKEISNQGALNILKAWARNESTKKGEDVPDILYFDDGMWANGIETEPGAVDYVRMDFRKLLPYFKNISKTSRLILRTQTPVKRWVATDNIPNAGLDFMNQIGWFILKDSDVWIWDTVTPFYLKEHDDCWAHWRTGLGKNIPNVWKCHDFQHPSKIAERIAANYIWNYVCNNIMNYSQNHCCSMQ